MWTPKRIVLLASGFALLLTVYFVYSHFLGGIDGLPPLPEPYFPPPGGVVAPPPALPIAVDEKLKMAFGLECPELKRAIKLEVWSRGLVLSTDDFSIEPDGRVRLQPVSLALFSKKTPPGKFPEINTVRSRVGYLKFDRPVSNLADLSSRKIVAGELSGGDVEIVNNRRKPQRGDELHVRIWGAPLYYDEAQHLIWTDGNIRLQDFQTKPLPTVVNARGMELHLTAEEPAGKGGKPAPRKPRNETVSGVDRVVLKSGVMMDLHVGSNFLSTGPEQPAAQPAPPRPGAPAPAEQPAKSHVVINTEGPFVYDVTKDRATFDIPRATSEFAVYQVIVVREREQGKHDRLECQHLELDFLRKNKDGADGADKPSAKGAPADAEERSVDLEIKTAHATGKDLLLTSDDTEALEARGNDFFYDASTSKVTIKGDPDPSDPDPERNRQYGMWASKGASKIRARELQVVNQKGAQTATALGPGDIRLYEKSSHAADRPETPAEPKPSVCAHWKDKLVSSKEGGLDLLTLTGEAAFVDEEHGQELRGDTLQVWLEPQQAKEAAQPSRSGAAPGTQPQTGGRRPRRVEAAGHVLAKSREMHVHDTDKLVLFFKDVPAPAPAVAPVAGHETAKPAAPALPDRPAAVAQPSPAVGPPPEAPAKPPRPIDLSARLVEAHVNRLSNNKNELEKLWTEGRVRVHQEPEKPEDQGIDIEGDTMQLVHCPARDGLPEGNKLTVTAAAEDLAKLTLDKMSIWGPIVNIDQVANKAWVDGQGTMWMKSDQDFQGKKLGRQVP
ncbi:MAG TPA: hypothetical protein VFA26_10265, partial [Gemmataceae bacterium]|nr:hypothetical protein [Gemmataceae bacterium]